MTALRCRRFPRGTVHIRTAGGDVVDFVDGHADVDDPEMVEALLAVPPVFGIETVEPADDPDQGDGSELDEPAGEADIEAEEHRVEAPAPPPKHGPGSGAEAWTAYGRQQGVDVPDGMKAGQIRELLDEHGVPTE